MTSAELPATGSADITGWLRRWNAGDGGALAELLPSVYGRLRQIAERLMRQERRGHTLQPTAVIHEAYFDLAGQKRVGWRNRDHFLGVAALLMQRVLLRHAERKRAAKRGGGLPDLPLEEAFDLPAVEPRGRSALADALGTLAALDPRQSQIVELRAFGGFTVEEIARALGVAPITVKRDWRMAKAWLRKELRVADVAPGSRAER